MNERDLSQKTPPRHTSPRRGTPDATEDIYPADTSRKDPDSQTGHQDAAAAAISPNAQPHSTKAVDPQIPRNDGQTIPKSDSHTCQHHLNVAQEPSTLS
jgi:hypothetical protein